MADTPLETLVFQCLSLQQGQMEENLDQNEVSKCFLGVDENISHFLLAAFPDLRLHFFALLQSNFRQMLEMVEKEKS